MMCGGYVLASPVAMNDAETIQSSGKTASSAPAMSSA
jgi:hypothetical protein